MDDFKALDKNIKKKLKNWKSTTLAKTKLSYMQIDKAYHHKSFGLNQLYERLYILKGRLDVFNLIKLPIIITLIFGVLLAIGQLLLNNQAVLYSDFNRQFDDKLIEGQNVISKTIITEYIMEAEKLRNKTNIYITSIGVFILILIMISFVSAFVFIKYLYLFYQIKQHVYLYEINKIEEIINILDKRSNLNDVAPAVLKIENGKYILEYELRSMSKKISM